MLFETIIFEGNHRTYHVKIINYEKKHFRGHRWANGDVFMNYFLQIYYKIILCVALCVTGKRWEGY